MYAIFRARIRTIDPARKASLRQRLLAEILARPPDERLNDKPFELSVASSQLPQPSDDKSAWWNAPDGTFSLEVPPPSDSRNTGVTNPFSSAYDRPAQQSSKPAVAPKSLPPVRRKPPPTPSSVDTSSHNGNGASLPSPAGSPSSPVKTKPPVPARPRALSGRRTAAQSIDSQDDSISVAGGTWQVVDAQK